MKKKSKKSAIKLSASNEAEPTKRSRRDALAVLGLTSVALTAPAILTVTGPFIGEANAQGKKKGGGKGTNDNPPNSDKAKK